MSTYTTTMLMAVIAVLVVSTCDCRINNLPTRCMPGLLEDAPPKVREACLTLSTIRTLSNAIETFIQDKQFPVPMPCEWSRDFAFRLSVNRTWFDVIGQRSSGRLESTNRFSDSSVFAILCKPPGIVFANILKENPTIVTFRDVSYKFVFRVKNIRTLLLEKKNVWADLHRYCKSPVKCIIIRVQKQHKYLELRFLHSIRISNGNWYNWKKKNTRIFHKI